MVRKTAGVQGVAEWTLPSSISYLADSREAHILMRDLRWGRGKKHCPRCNASAIYSVNTDDSRELFRCRDCDYQFKSLAGTFFQATHMPLNKILQFLVVQNAYGDALSMTDLCFVMGCTYATAKLWRARGHEVQSPEKFVGIDRDFAATLASATPSQAAHADDFFPFCQMRGIVVNDRLMREYLRWVCQCWFPRGTEPVFPPRSEPLLSMVF